MNKSENFTPLYDVNEIRKQAMKSIDSGAVTQDYPLDVSRACFLLNQALSTEILCVLRYRHHQIIAKGIDFPQVAEEFEEHADTEEEHMLMLAERIDQLGGDPSMNPAEVTKNSVAEYGSEKSLMGMIREDLVAERAVIEVYRKMIQWFGVQDPTTRRMLEKILEDEEEHANDLANLLASVDRKYDTMS